MTERRSRKIRLKVSPGSEADTYFRKACGVKRFVFNWGLGLITNEFGRAFVGPRRPSYSFYSLRQELNTIKTRDFPWMLEVSKCVPACALSDLETAMKNFWESRSGKRQGERVGFPKFKCKGKAKESFSLESDKVNITESGIKVPLLGQVSFAEQVVISGKVSRATISLSAGQWFVSLTFENEASPERLLPPRNDKTVGIDWGVKEIVLSSGKRYAQKRSYRSLEKKVKRLSRQKARKKPGTKNRLKHVLKIQKVHEKIANVRQDFTHKTTSAIAKKYDVVLVESLNTKGMMKNHCLAKSIADANPGEFARQLSYKAKKLHKINTFFPSSKQCRRCGVKNENLTLSHRTFTCENQACGHSEDRDLHAAKNIHQEGLRNISEMSKNTVSQTEIHACGEDASTLGRKKAQAEVSTDQEQATSTNQEIGVKQETRTARSGRHRSKDARGSNVKSKKKVLQTAI